MSNQNPIPFKRRRLSISFPKGERRTKSSFKAECDINNILARFQKTGAFDHMNKHEASYGFATGQSFQEAVNTVNQAKQMFADLPSTLRIKFNHDPAAYLEFVQNPDNLEEMAELGLLTEEAATRLSEPPVTIEGTPPPITPGDPE